MAVRKLQAWLTGGGFAWLSFAFHIFVQEIDLENSEILSNIYSIFALYRFCLTLIIFNAWVFASIIIFFFSKF